MYFHVNDFSSFHLDSLWDTIGWECIVKDDSVRSCLIELKSFLLSKLYVDPIHRILMFLPCLSACIVQDAVLSGRLSQDLCVLCPKDSQAARILSVFCSIFVLPVSILNL